MILPRVKELCEEKGLFSPPLVFPETENGKAAVRLLALFCPACTVTVGAQPNVVLTESAFPCGGEYRLAVTEKAVTLCYGDFEGLRNAVATLSGLETDGGFSCATVHDYPDNAFRSCLLDLARGYVELPRLREHLIRLAKLKFNYVHLHLMDGHSYILQSDVVPNPDGRRQYTKSEMREILALCRRLGLEVIPEIEFPTHAVNLIRAIPALACDIIDLAQAEADVEAATDAQKDAFLETARRVSGWAVCLGKESTYAVFDAILDEIVSLFDGEYIHIGGDEIAFAHLAALPHWDNCHACRALVEAYHGDLLSVYHHAIRRIHEMVRAKGKKTIKWNEIGENDHAIDLPTDLILQYFLSAEPDRAQADLDRFLSLGFSVINAQHQYTYVDVHGYMNADKIRTWSPAVTPQQKKGILGGEMCAWELGNPEYAFYHYTLPICMVFFSDRVWNTDATPYTEAYTHGVFCNAVGQNVRANPLRLIGETIPPRSRNVLVGIDRAATDTAAVGQMLDELERYDPAKGYGALAFAAFKDYWATLYRALRDEASPIL